MFQNLPQNFSDIARQAIYFADVVPQPTAKKLRFSLDESRFTSASSSFFISYVAKLWSGDRFLNML